MKLTPSVFGDRGRKRAEKLGIDPARLPPGQSPTLKWPVLTVGPSPEVPIETWSLSFYGAVEEPYAVRWDELTALERVTQVSDLHCVTRWSRFDQQLTGVRVRHAQQLLESTAHGVEKIGRDVGFSSPANFREQFRRLTGVAPQSYRNTFRDRLAG